MKQKHLFVTKLTAGNKGKLSLWPQFGEICQKFLCVLIRQKNKMLKWFRSIFHSVFVNLTQGQSSKHKHLFSPSACNQTHPPPSDIQGELTHSSSFMSDLLIFTFVLYQMILCSVSLLFSACGLLSMHAVSSAGLLLIRIHMLFISASTLPLLVAELLSQSSVLEYNWIFKMEVKWW